MNSGKLKSILLLSIAIIISPYLFAQTSEETNEDETLKLGLQILKRYFYEENKWYVAKPTVANDVRGLIDFIENPPVDTVINNLKKTSQDGQTYVFRLPENVSDSLKVEGYMAYPNLKKRITEIKIKLQKEFEKKQTNYPKENIAELEKKLNLLPKGKGIELFNNGTYKMPGNLIIPDVIPDSVMNSVSAFNRIIKIDSLREDYIEQKRIAFNDSVISVYTDSIKASYGEKMFDKEFSYQVKRLTDSVKVNNYNVLRLYNELVVKSVNDSIATILATLTDYADFIDSTQISFYNLSGTKSDIMLKSGNDRFSRVWLKNVQNDSLSMLVKSVGKRSVSMIIDDGATISRYKPKEKVDFNFKTLEKNISSLNKVGNLYQIETPWVIGGDGHLGFSQTYLSNWEKGGKSAIASLLVLKGFANYKRADAKIKWDNSGELRSGWMRPGGKDEEVQKNDDKFEITSRFGVSAFKKWYYSSEFNFNTQLFNGYKYPKAQFPNPISGFLAPSRMFFKVGMEYKPSKEFSVLLSPFTVKNVYVRDTSLFNQTKFGIDADDNSFWEPGLNADIYFKKSFKENISYETKYKMFVNYKKPFQKFDINWENNISVKLNEFINVRFLIHLIYDDDVKFAVYDDNNIKIGEKAKLQVKEYFSIGFTYKINHNVTHAKRIN